MNSDRRLNSPKWKIFLLALGLLVLTEVGEARGEDAIGTVTLQGRWNARSEAYFSGRSNIVGIARKGVRADVLESKITDSGLPAYRVRFQNGDLKGRTLWIGGAKLKITSIASSAITTGATPQENPDDLYQPTPKIATNVKARQKSPKAAPSQFSDLSEQAISKYGSNLMNTVPTDIGNYCPAYSYLSEEQRLGFWKQLVSGLMKFESGYRPSSGYKETSMGRDYVTGRQVVSEGLLQLSYQDERTYKRILPASACPLSSRGGAAILDPQINLNCGVAILDYQVGRSKTISTLVGGKTWTGGGKYWATLRTSRSLNGIQNMTKNYCRQVTEDSRSSAQSSGRRVVVR